MVALARAFGREPATPDEAREIKAMTPLSASTNGAVPAPA
jgi:hypothetical protein